MRDLLPCLLRLLNLSKSAKNSDKTTNGASSHDKPASSGANWRKLKAPIKSYLTDLLTVTFIFKTKYYSNLIISHFNS